MKIRSFPDEAAGAPHSTYVPIVCNTVEHAATAFLYVLSLLLPRRYASLISILNSVTLCSCLQLVCARARDVSPGKSQPPQGTITEHDAKQTEETLTIAGRHLRTSLALYSIESGATTPRVSSFYF